MTEAAPTPAPENPRRNFPSVSELCAAACRKLGWATIPVKARGKKPLVEWQPYQRRLPTPAENHEWFTRWPDANVGIVTGAVSGLVAVAQGRPFVGCPTKQGGVLILAVEEHPRDVRSRLTRFGAQSGDPIYVHAAPLDHSSETMTAISAFVRENGVTLVILDTLARWWDVRDENDNAGIVRAVSPLLDMARETGAAVLLVHHERKSGGEDGRGIRGGSALFGLVDQSLELLPRQGSNERQRTLKALGRYSETPRELILELVGDEYRRVGTPAEMGGEANQEKVWAAMSTSQPKTEGELAEETKLDRTPLRSAIKGLGNRVRREGEGVRGNPYTYRRAPEDSILTKPLPNRSETNWDNPWVDTPGDTPTC